MKITQKRKSARAGVMRDAVGHDPLFEVASVAILLADAGTGILLEANRAAEQLLGRTRNDLCGRRYTDLLPEDQATAAAAVVEARGLRGGAPQEMMALRGDGMRIPVEASSSRIDHLGRKVIAIFLRDISTCWRHTEALRESQTRFQKIVMNTQAGYFLIDGKGRFQDVNSAWLQMHGYESRDEVIGLHFSMTQVDADVNAAQRYVDSILAGASIPSGEFTRRRKDGSVGYHTFSAVPVMEGRRIVGLEGFVIDISEKKEFDQRYRSTVELSPVGMLFYRLESGNRLIFEGGNPAADTLLGIPAARLVGKTIEDAFPALANTELPGHYRRVAASGGHWGVDGLAYSNGGISGIYNVIVFQTEPRRVAVMFTDIADRKAIEAALLESERLLSTIFNSAFQFIGLLTPAGILIEANQTALEFAGITREQIVGKPFWRARWWRGNPARVRRLKQAIALASRGEFVRYEEELQGRGERTAVCDFSLKPVEDSNGRVILLVPEGRDITEKKRAEDQLSMFSESLENATDAIGMSTPEGRHYYQNKAFSALFGEIGDNPPTTLYVDRTVGEEVFKTIMAGGRWAGEVKMHSRDGTLLDIDLRAYGNRDAQGRVTGLVGIHTDITGRKRAVAELRRAHDRLEIKVRGRTSQLRNLAAQLTRAEHKERRRIAEILHEDLQQRLVAIRYRIGVLKARERKRSIALDAEWLLDELSNVLRLSRDLTTRLRPPVLYDVGLKEALVWLSEQIREGLGLAVRVEKDDAWDFESDDVRVFVYEAVSELLLNVVKHAGVRSARVWMRKKGPGTASIVVADRGRGFNPARGVRSTTFGLFSLRERAEAFGGSLEVTSRPGRGTRATLTLPIKGSAPV